MTRKMEREVEEMGGYGDWIERQGIEQGIEQGILHSIEKLMANMKLTSEQAMEVLDIPKKDRTVFADRLKENA